MRHPVALTWFYFIIGVFLPFGPTVLGAQPAAGCVVNLQKNAILSHKVKKCRRMPMPKSRTHIIGISLCAGLLRASLRFLEFFYVSTFKRNMKFRNLEYLMTNKIPECLHIFNTSYLTDSYISSTLKMESVTKNAIFGLKMMVKSGLKKYF